MVEHICSTNMTVTFAILEQKLVGESSEISRLEQANTLGLAYLRTMLTLNGGAILALLTYFGNVKAETAIVVPLDSLQWAISSFTFAICVMLLTLAISYSFTASAPETPYSRFWNNWIVLLNSIAALTSLAAFISGVLFVTLGATAP
ncbi:hypothetical protein [Pseudophaeobacter flagellatus]|uniref:hypothetical protein n=1 Tax=Pseudophaeobacter flagellatus TaxID=2899119 RepID=UPI001E477423|nr:hypothetical protein [Pseudophaeobacter flagellatus]MCD9148234.1 hypothetical protein [Pseudophaeobacter flagellatus]